MEEHGNNEIFGVDRKQMRAVGGKQEIYLEWPKLHIVHHAAHVHVIHASSTSLHNQRLATYLPS